MSGKKGKQKRLLCQTDDLQKQRKIRLILEEAGITSSLTVSSCEKEDKFRFEIRVEMEQFETARRILALQIPSETS